MISELWSTLRHPALPLMLAARAGNALGYPSQTLNLLLRMRLMNAKMPAHFRDYVPRYGDVFVATFAKSGTNWAMQIAQQIAYRGRADFEHIHALVPWPEDELPQTASLDDASIFRRCPTGRRVIKTHLPARLIPDSDRVRYLTVLRDPKEVLVSAYYFLVGLFGLLDRVSFADWYAQAAQRGPFLLGWAEHAASMWARRDRPNTLVLSYGEMKADLGRSVDRVADLMGVALSETERAAVVERSSLAYMKRHEAKFAPPAFPMRRPSPLPAMVRRGQAGGGRELMETSQRAAVDDVCRSALNDLGSDLPYEKLFATA